MPPADNTPDFDAMSPEELMAWMETLAERQGATEGFTTEKRMDIEEVDPDSVDDSGPSYIPFGMSEEQWAKKQEEEAARKAARQAQTPPPSQQPAASTPPPSAVQPPQPEPESEPEEAPAGMDWLASFGDEPAEEGFPEMDLTDLGSELESLDMDVMGGGDDTDPMQWLDSLVEEQGSAFNLPADALDMPGIEDEQAEEIPQVPADDVDPLEWLESLARTQGAADEEFVTPARASIPPDEPDDTADDYQEYTFETEGAVDGLDEVEAIDPDDPVAWLESLASAHNPSARAAFEAEDEDIDADYDEEDELVEEEGDTQQVIESLNQGISDPEVMRGWMDNLLEQGASRTDVPDYIEEEDESEVIEADLPDWLLEQVGEPPSFDEVADEVPAQQETVGEAADLPDWLKEDLQMPDDEALENIFADEEEAQPVAEDVVTADAPIIDSSDPWVEAFELERTEMADPDDVPEWYAERLRELDAGEAELVEEASAVAAIQDVALEPEIELPNGEPEPVPAWMQAEFTEEAEPVAEVTEEEEAEALPDWLHLEAEPTFAEMEESDELPDWLKEAASEEEELAPGWLTQPAAQVATAEDIIMPEPEATPAPPPVPVGTAEVAETLERAREKLSQHDVEGGLQEYESVIRVSAQLSDVVSDLSALVKQDEYKSNAAVYRVLGDGLMRLGRLQDALDTYRKALNLL